MKYLYIDGHSGASGDMLLAAIIACGADLNFIQKSLVFSQIPNLSIGIQKTNRGGMDCSLLLVDFPAQTQYRHLSEILAILNSSFLPNNVKKQSSAIFSRLGAAEAKVHGVALEDVHFHEIGAVDTIVDIVGFCAALHFLSIDKVVFSPLATGSGLMKVAHGIMPIPAPATAELLKGFSIMSGPVRSELLTPTGAAILTTLGTQSLSMPSGTLINTGVSCGTKVFKGHPNVLRMYIVDDATKSESSTFESIIEVETDLDHISGEILAYCSEKLFENGALDVTYTPIFMKKGRPAYHLRALCQKENVKKIAEIIMQETHTLGVRYCTKERIIAVRSNNQETWHNEEIRTKSCEIGSYKFTKAEYESLARIAKKTNTPLIEIALAYSAENRKT